MKNHYKDAWKSRNAALKGEKYFGNLFMFRIHIVKQPPRMNKKEKTSNCRRGFGHFKAGNALISRDTLLLSLI
jgi:hypothetical protein